MRRNAEDNGGDRDWSQSRLQVFSYGRWPTVQRLKRRSIEMRKQMTELLLRGGFHLQKWLTNDPEVLATIPVEARHSLNADKVIRCVEQCIF